MIFDSQNFPSQIQQDDFTKFDYIFGMDNENISNLKKIAPSNYKGTIALLGSYDPQNELIIRDPYYVSFFQNIITLSN